MGNEQGQADIRLLIDGRFQKLRPVSHCPAIVSEGPEAVSYTHLFEPATSTRNSKLGSALRLSFDQVDASMSGHTRAPSLAQFDEPYGFREAGD